MKKWLLTLFIGCSLALAHAELENSSPLPDSVVKSSPSLVEVSFTEAIETKLSIFKVYKLEGSFSSIKASHAAAAELIRRAILAKNDQAKRFDVGLDKPAETAPTVRIALKSGLPPGQYLVMWKVLSVDGHVTTDFFLFSYKP